MNLQRLLSDPHFQNYAADRLRVAGLPVENNNPGETLVLRFHQEAPDMCRAYLQTWMSVHEQHYGAAPAEPPPATPKPNSGFWQKAVDAEEAVKNFNALPKDSQIREFANARELDDLAVSKGIGVLPGLKTPGESIAAYLLAGSKVDAVAANYAELATLTRGAFGTAEELRDHFRAMSGIHGAGELVAHRDAVERERWGGREPEVPTMSKEAQEEAGDREALRQQMREGLDRVEASQPRSKRSTTRIDNSDRLDWELAWRKASREPTHDIELSPEVERQVTQQTNTTSGSAAIEHMSSEIPEPMGDAA